MYRLFNKNIGKKSYQVSFHWRGLKIPLTADKYGPSNRRIAHWALQVGPHFYELATSSEDYVVLAVFDELLQQLSRSSSAEDDEDDDDDDDDGDNDDDDEEDIADADEANLESFELESEGTYEDYTSPTEIVEGRSVPLQISRVNQWSRLNAERRSHQMLLFKTTVEPWKVRERAIHIYTAAFQDRYSPVSYNCQAFVCYLIFSLLQLEHKWPKYNQYCRPFIRVFGEQKWLASISIYTHWRNMIGEKIDMPFNPVWKKWKEDEDDIDYKAIIPPWTMAVMRAEMERDGRRPRHEVRRRQGHRHTDVRSHAAHQAEVAHRELTHDRQIVHDNAVLAQLQVTQQTSNLPDNSFFSTPGLGLPMPGVNF